MSNEKHRSNDREKGIYRVTWIGSVVNALLLVLKFTAGLLGHSAAMIADAVHSLSDFITDVIVVVFVRISNKPEDKDHVYGHGKYETLATLIIGVLLFFVGIGILWQGASSIYGVLFRNEKIETPGWIALGAALVSIIMKEALYHYTNIRGKALKSQTVIANAWHHRSDAFSSIGTAIGIGGAAFLGEQWVILDPIAAMVVSFFICKVAFQLAKPCLDELLEKSLPEKTVQAILQILNGFPEVSDPHHLRTRSIGNYCAVEVHIRMDGTTSLEAAHDTATRIEVRIKELLGPSTIVNIHLEPRK